MNVLYVVGSCLTKNTSANMSHNGYVQGLLENGCKVDILMAEDSWGETDASLPTWQQARYFTFPSVSLPDRIRKALRGSGASAVSSAAAGSSAPARNSISIKACIRRAAKALFYRCFPNDPIYPLEHTWLKKAMGFRNDRVYDLVISNSSPAASHKLVYDLMKAGHLKAKRWAQIWEDPWFFDLYGGHSDAILAEEHRLLQEATEIYYVSPLTLQYQQQYFPDCASKMAHIPLPYFDFSEEEETAIDRWSFGYFGDYYSVTRNLQPFYEALAQTGHPGYIYGNSDLSLAATESIDISGRVTLDKLAQVQANTKVLVHLCNLRGGQIPGKVYHYCATDKPILFILDGTPTEIAALQEYFSQFNRFYFCENNVASIRSAILQICSENKSWGKVTAFSPETVVRQLLM